RSSRCSHTAPARRSPSAACQWRSAGRSRPFLWRLAGDDIAPASVMRRAPTPTSERSAERCDARGATSHAIILIYRKPKHLRSLPNRFQPVKERIVRLNGLLNRNVVGIFETNGLQKLASNVLHGLC